MLTGKIRNNIDKLWERFWTGGITNPLTVIEQISYLMLPACWTCRRTWPNARPSTPAS